jgi:starvation-inducible outer membrane lipoprotein
MKRLFLAIAAGMLSACVSAPSDLYGIHQAKPEAPAAPAKQMAATGHQQ